MSLLFLLLSTVFYYVGCWRKVRCVEELKNRAVFEMFTGGYLSAEVNPSFSHFN